MAATVDAGPYLRLADAGRAHWSDAASIPTRATPSGVSLARACFEDAPASMRAFLVVGWVLLLLEGRPRSDASHVLGWPVTEHAGAALCRRRSRLGIHAVLVFETRSGSLVFASGMRFTNPAARVLWKGVAPVHRWAVRRVLTLASARLSARP